MGSVTLQSGETVVYSGDDVVRQGGVAIIMNVNAKRALMEWTPIGKRIITARFCSKYQKADSNASICTNKRCGERGKG